MPTDKRKIAGVGILLAGIATTVYLQKKGILKTYFTKLFGGSNSKSSGYPAVTQVSLTPNQNTINDGSQLSVTWGIVGGSGSFSGQLSWGDGNSDQVSGSGSAITHTYKVGNSLAQVIALILTLKDSKTGIDYRQVQNVTINPTTGQNPGPGGGTVGNPTIEIDPGTATLDSGDRLHIPVSYKNIGSQTISFVALMQFVDGFGVVRALASINLSIGQGNMQSFEFVTNSLPPEIFVHATTIQLYAWKSLSNPEALATVVDIPLSASQL